MEVREGEREGRREGERERGREKERETHFPLFPHVSLTPSPERCYECRVKPAGLFWTASHQALRWFTYKSS